MATATFKTQLMQKYKSEIVPAMQKEFNYPNPMQIPRLKKVVINMGVKEGAQDIKVIETLQQELSVIAGQKAVLTRAKKSIAAFKLREGVPIGVKVTLRGSRMYEFLERLFNVAMPRIRDFRGFSPRSFDQQGNYSLGLQEQIIFPEIEYDKVKRTQGMDITFVTSATNKEEAKRFLQLLGLPFSKN